MISCFSKDAFNVTSSLSMLSNLGVMLEVFIELMLIILNVCSIVFPCFQYQVKQIGTCPGVFPTCRTYVTDLEVTLTEQTEYKDPTSKQFQTETKALLNVSPRNVFNAWELDGAGQVVRVQPMPPTITALLPEP